MKRMGTFVLLLSALLFAQPRTLWIKNISEGSLMYHGTYWVEQTRDRGYIIAGACSYLYPCIQKRDSLGEFMWLSVYDSLGGFETAARCIRQTEDGNYIVVACVEAVWTYVDIHLIRIDSLGNVLWSKVYGGEEWDMPGTFQITEDGGYIIVGETSSFGKGGYDVYVIKTDSLGDTLWTRTYGGLEDDVGRWIEATEDKGYIIVGSTKSYGRGKADVYLIKIDSLGNVLWEKTYGGEDEDEGRVVHSTCEGGYIIIGITSSFEEERCGYLIKIDSVGNVLWEKTYECLALSGEELGRNGYIIGGYITYGTTSYPYLLRVDTLGNVIWDKKYSDTVGSFIRCVHRTHDGGYIILTHDYLIKTAPDETGIGEERHVGLTGFSVLEDRIRYEVRRNGRVIIEMYDATGRRVKKLLDEYQKAGRYEIKIEREGIPSGLYFIILKTPEGGYKGRVVIIE